MKIRFNATGSQRKELVKAISEITGADSKYLGAPGFAYEVDYLTIDREGTMIFDDRADSEQIEKLLKGLAERGFIGEGEKSIEPQEDEKDLIGLCISLNGETYDEGARKRLRALVDSKAELIKNALDVKELPIEFTQDRISFNWFNYKPNPEETKAYTKFIEALYHTAKAQERVTAKEKAVANEKYAFRCFLLKLGFIGAEYKDARRILLQNLSGNTAFLTGKKKEASENEVSE